MSTNTTSPYTVPMELQLAPRVHLRYDVISRILDSSLSMRRAAAQTATGLWHRFLHVTAEDSNELPQTEPSTPVHAILQYASDDVIESRLQAAASGAKRMRDDRDRSSRANSDSSNSVSPIRKVRSSRFLFPTEDNAGKGQFQFPVEEKGSRASFDDRSPLPGSAERGVNTPRDNHSIANNADIVEIMRVHDDKTLLTRPVSRELLERLFVVVYLLASVYQQAEEKGDLPPQSAPKTAQQQQFRRGEEATLQSVSLKHLHTAMVHMLKDIFTASSAVKLFMDEADVSNFRVFSEKTDSKTAPTDTKMQTALAAKLFCDLFTPGSASGEMLGAAVSTSLPSASRVNAAVQNCLMSEWLEIARYSVQLPEVQLFEADESSDDEDDRWDYDGMEADRVHDRSDAAGDVRQEKQLDTAATNLNLALNPLNISLDQVKPRVLTMVDDPILMHVSGGIVASAASTTVGLQLDQVSSTVNTAISNAIAKEGKSRHRTSSTSNIAAQAAKRRSMIVDTVSSALPKFANFPKVNAQAFKPDGSPASFSLLEDPAMSDKLLDAQYVSLPEWLSMCFGPIATAQHWHSTFFWLCLLTYGALQSKSVFKSVQDTVLIAQSALHPCQLRYKFVCPFVANGLCFPVSSFLISCLGEQKSRKSYMVYGARKIICIQHEFCKTGAGLDQVGAVPLGASSFLHLVTRLSQQEAFYLEVRGAAAAPGRSDTKLNADAAAKLGRLPELGDAYQLGARSPKAEKSPSDLLAVALFVAMAEKVADIVAHLEDSITVMKRGSSKVDTDTLFLMNRPPEGLVVEHGIKDGTLDIRGLAGCSSSQCTSTLEYVASRRLLLLVRDYFRCRISAHLLSISHVVQSPMGKADPTSGRLVSLLSFPSIAPLVIQLLAHHFPVTLHSGPATDDCPPRLLAITYREWMVLMSKPDAPAALLQMVYGMLQLRLNKAPFPQEVQPRLQRGTLAGGMDAPLVLSPRVPLPAFGEKEIKLMTDGIMDAAPVVGNDLYAYINGWQRKHVLESETFRYEEWGRRANSLLPLTADSGFEAIRGVCRQFGVDKLQLLLRQAASSMFVALSSSGDASLAMLRAIGSTPSRSHLLDALSSAGTDFDFSIDEALATRCALGCESLDSLPLLRRELSNSRPWWMVKWEAFEKCRTGDVLYPLTFLHSYTGEEGLSSCALLTANPVPADPSVKQLNDIQTRIKAANESATKDGSVCGIFAVLPASALSQSLMSAICEACRAHDHDPVLERWIDFLSDRRGLDKFCSSFIECLIEPTPPIDMPSDIESAVMIALRKTAIMQILKRCSNISGATIKDDSQADRDKLIQVIMDRHSAQIEDAKRAAASVGAFAKLAHWFSGSPSAHLQIPSMPVVQVLPPLTPGSAKDLRLSASRILAQAELTQSRIAKPFISSYKLLIEAKTLCLDHAAWVSAVLGPGADSVAAPSEPGTCMRTATRIQQIGYQMQFPFVEAATYMSECVAVGSLACEIANAIEDTGAEVAYPTTDLAVEENRHTVVALFTAALLIDLHREVEKDGVTLADCLKGLDMERGLVASMTPLWQQIMTSRMRDLASRKPVAASALKGALNTIAAASVEQRVKAFLIPFVPMMAMHVRSDGAVGVPEFRHIVQQCICTGCVNTKRAPLQVWLDIHKDKSSIPKLHSAALKSLLHLAKRLGAARLTTSMLKAESSTINDAPDGHCKPMWIKLPRPADAERVTSAGAQIDVSAGSASKRWAAPSAAAIADETKPVLARVSKTAGAAEVPIMSLEAPKKKSVDGPTEAKSASVRAALPAVNQVAQAAVEPKPHVISAPISLGSSNTATPPTTLPAATIDAAVQLPETQPGRAEKMLTREAPQTKSLRRISISVPPLDIAKADK